MMTTKTSEVIQILKNATENVWQSADEVCRLIVAGGIPSRGLTVRQQPVLTVDVGNRPQQPSFLTPVSLWTGS